MRAVGAVVKADTIASGLWDVDDVGGNITLGLGACNKTVRERDADDTIRPSVERLTFVVSPPTIFTASIIGRGEGCCIAYSSA